MTRLQREAIKDAIFATKGHQKAVLKTIEGRKNRGMLTDVYDGMSITIDKLEHALNDK